MINSQVLIIEGDSSDKKVILDEFRKHKLTNSITFSKDENEAMIDIGLFDGKNNVIEYPKIMMLNYSSEGLDFIRNVRSDIRFRTVKIYFMVNIDAIPVIDRQILFEHRISGVVIKPISFKAIDNQSYLDTFSLYLDLLSQQTFQV